MNTKSILIGIISMVSFMSNAQNKIIMQTQEQQNVLNVISKMTEAFHKGNLEDVMSTYEPTAIVIFEPGQTITDHQQLREAFKQAFIIKPQFTYSGHEVFISNDIATHIAPWIMNATAPDGTKIEQTGLSIAILRKQTDGSWLIIQDNPHGDFLLRK